MTITEFTSSRQHLFPNADIDAVEIGRLYALARTSLVDSVKYTLECGLRLIAKKQTMHHGEWLPWLAANEPELGFKERAARLMMKAASNRQLTADLDETTAVAISRQLWGNDNVRGTQGTGENEWFTPTEYIERARSVLGAIDLDPATHEQAQNVVRAERYFTLQDDGLRHEWHGRVWLNPPYAQPWIAQFAAKMCDERSSGRVTAAIMLTHNYTDTSWFQQLAAIADAICFTRGRVKFYEPNGEIAAPTQGQAFLYFGDQVERFAIAFREVGFVVLPFNGEVHNAE